MNQASRQTISRKERDQIFDDFGKHISKGQIRYLTAGHLGVLEGERDGIRFQESQSGKTYLDGFSSAGCFNVGRCNPRVIKSLEASVDDYDMGTYGMLSAPKIKLAKLLAEVAPGDLNRNPEFIRLLAAGRIWAVLFLLPFTRGSRGCRLQVGPGVYRKRSVKRNFCSYLPQGLNQMAF